MAESASSPAREAIRGTVPMLAEYADKIIYGEVWERPQLSKRDRSLITCGALMATRRFGTAARPPRPRADQRRDQGGDQRTDHPPRLLFRLADRDDRGDDRKGGVRGGVAATPRRGR